MDYYKDYPCFKCVEDLTLVEVKSKVIYKIENIEIGIINIPMGKCNKCHEEYIHAELNEKIIKIFENVKSTNPTVDIIINFEEYLF